MTGIFLNHPELLGRPAPRRTVAFDPVDASRMFRGGDILEVSTDGGSRWREVPMLIPALDVVDIAFAPDDPAEVWVATRTGLVRSQNGGKVWEPIALDFAPLAEGIEVEGLALGPGGTVRVLTDAGHLASADGGATWSPAPDAPVDVNGLYAFVHQLHTGYLVGPALVRVHDAAAISVVVLSVTGFLLWRRGRKNGNGSRAGREHAEP